MACAPSIVPMLGCCGDDRPGCVGIFVEAFIQLTGPLVNGHANPFGEGAWSMRVESQSQRGNFDSHTDIICSGWGCSVYNPTTTQGDFNPYIECTPPVSFPIIENTSTRYEHGVLCGNGYSGRYSTQLSLRQELQGLARILFSEGNISYPDPVPGAFVLRKYELVGNDALLRSDTTITDAHLSTSAGWNALGQSPGADGYEFNTLRFFASKFRAYMPNEFCIKTETVIGDVAFPVICNRSVGGTILEFEPNFDALPMDDRVGVSSHVTEIYTPNPCRQTPEGMDLCCGP
jgi:hypothetical protein